MKLKDSDANFTSIKQVLDYLIRMLGKESEYKIENGEHPSFIDGRCGTVIINGKTIGFLGEITPQILENLKIKMPVCALEVDIEQLCK